MLHSWIHYGDYLLLLIMLCDSIRLWISESAVRPIYVAGIVVGVLFLFVGCGPLPTSPRTCPVFSDTLDLTQANIDTLRAERERAGCE